MTKSLLDVETKYPELEKLALALMVASKKLRPYFHAHPIEVLTNYPLRQVLQNSEASGMLLKWAIELGQLKVNFHPDAEKKWPTSYRWNDLERFCTLCKKRKNTTRPCDFSTRPCLSHKLRHGRVLMADCFCLDHTTVCQHNTVVSLFDVNWILVIFNAFYWF